MLTWANILTSLRVFIAPAFFYFIITGDPVDTRIAILIFGIGAITDFFDGYLARRFAEESEFGNFMDPLADKILVLSAFFSFVFLDIVPLSLVLVIIARDAATTVIRVYADSKGHPLKTSSSAKWKTALQMIYVFLVLLFIGVARTPELASASAFASAVLSSPVPAVVLAALAAFTVITFAEYVVKNSYLFRRGS
ncbi:MAG: CDP-diacylglycerol--glycerol-3-phosphate 3-phosphatidyltransferase [Candidatus Kapaibacterium sp.]